jgi:hypothetical protein
MYAPSAMSIFGMDMCAIQKFLFHFNSFISGKQSAHIKNLHRPLYGLTFSNDYHPHPTPPPPSHFSAFEQVVPDFGEKKKSQ